jgi:hypothetical protein
MELQLYEILVPNKPKLHNSWDARIIAITSGLTLTKRVKGKWNGETEEMIPVRIACTYPQIRQIAEMTKRHYNQKAVMFYIVASFVEII